MSGFVAILRREILERSRVLLVAAVASLVPLVVPAVRGLAGAGAAEARAWIALMIAAAFGLGLSIGLGASMLVPRIASRRIAFDLSRPVGGGAIWAASLAAATGLAAAAAAIVCLPAWLAGAKPVVGDLFPEPAPARLWLFAGVAALVALFSLVHFLTLAFRSRAALLALDAALAVAAWLGLSAALSRLPVFLAASPFLTVAIGSGIVAAVAFVWAGHASVACGRTDIRAAHRAASLRAWSLVGTAVVLANVYASWVVAARPSDLSASGFWVRPADTGPWIEVAGQARGARANFLYDTSTGRFERTRTVDWRGPALSRHGNLAAWVEGRDRGGPLGLRIRRLDDPKGKPVATGIFFAGYPSLLELSPEGSRLAAWENGMLSIFDVGQERALASARVPVGDQQELRGLFVGPDAFRLYRVSDRAIEILEMDVRARALERLGRFEGSGGRYFVTDDRGARLLALDGPNNRVRLLDGATGALLATLADEPVVSRWPSLLPDGRIVLSERLQNGRRLRVFDSSGKEESSIALPPAVQVTLGGEVAPGQLAVGIADERSRQAIWLLDLQNGSLRKVAEDLRPVWAFGVAAGLGSEATKLFYGPDQRSLIRFDPLTGERRVFLGGR